MAPPPAPSLANAPNGLLKQPDLLDRILRLQHCGCEHSLRDELMSLSARLGFDAFIYGGRFPTPAGPTDRVITSYSSSWRGLYQARRYDALDPTVQHSMRSVVPLVWSPEMYITPEQQTMREEALAYGVGQHGVTYPVHSVSGEISMVSLTVQGAERHAREVLSESMGWGALLGGFVHDAVRRLAQVQPHSERPQLTGRELETLKWVAAGKTTWEISRLLSISEHGVVHHVRNVMKKFDVTSRHQAVVRALALGLI